MPDDPKDDPTPEPEPKDDPKPQGDGTDWKAEARKWEQRAKDNKSAADELQQLKEADKTEAQKAADRAAEAEKRATEAESRALRLEVAQDKGLTPAQAKRLAGTSKEELEADADELLETFAPAKTDDEGEPPGTSRRPKERLTPGASASAEPEETDPRKLAADLPRY